MCLNPKAAFFLLNHTYAHELWLGLSSVKANGSSSRAGTGHALPLPAKSTCLLHSSAMLATTPVSLPSSFQAWGGLFPEAKPQLPHSICCSPITHTTLPWGRRGEERKGGVAKPRHWDHWLTLSRHALSPWPSPASPPPSNNTGNSAKSFRQYPAPHSLPQIQGEQGGAEGQTEVGAGAAPTP